VIASIESADKLCIVKWVGRRGLKALAVSYCGGEHNAGDGTVQVPDKIFREGMVWQSVETGKPITACVLCKRAAGL
jgi:hypothetical protein